LFGQEPQMLQCPPLSVFPISRWTPEYAAFITARGAKWITPFASVRTHFVTAGS
jgi:hypothetical protein